MVNSSSTADAWPTLGRDQWIGKGSSLSRAKRESSTILSRTMIRSRRSTTSRSATSTCKTSPSRPQLQTQEGTTSGLKAQLQYVAKERVARGEWGTSQGGKNIEGATALRLLRPLLIVPQSF